MPKPTEPNRSCVKSLIPSLIFLQRHCLPVLQTAAFPCPTAKLQTRPRLKVHYNFTSKHRTCIFFVQRCKFIVIESHTMFRVLSVEFDMKPGAFPSSQQIFSHSPILLRPGTPFSASSLPSHCSRCHDARQRTSCPLLHSNHRQVLF